MKDNLLIDKSIAFASRIISDCLEIKRILVASINTAKEIKS